MRRRRHDALPVRAGEQDAELVAERDQLGLVGATLLARFAVPGRGEEGGADALGGAGPEQRRGWPPSGCTRTPGRRRPSGSSSMLRNVSTPSTDAPSQVGGEHLALVAVGEDVVEGHEPELARMGRRPGHHDPLRVEQRSKRSAHPRSVHRDWRLPANLGEQNRASGSLSSTRASTAIGLAVDDDERVEVDRDQLRMGDRGVIERHQHVDDGVAIDRRLAAELAEQRLRGEIVEHLARRRRG